MNNTKLTLEQFLIKKNECQRLLNNIRQLYEQESANTEYDLKQIELKYINMYLEAQKELLSYDLSDIPFEAWQGFEIASDEAIAQINYNGNRYSSAIFTTSIENASRFIKEVKSKIVTINSSPTIERLIDIKQSDLFREKTIIYPLSFKFTNSFKFEDK